MTYKQYILPRKYSWLQRARVSIQLSKLFSVYERGMANVLQDAEANRNNSAYFSQTAPLMAVLFHWYNSDLPAYRVLELSVEYLQVNAQQNPVAKLLLQDFLVLAGQSGIYVRTVINKTVS